MKAPLAVLLLTTALAAGSPALAQENRSRRFAPGVCGPADPSYIRMAEETGGIPMFLLPSEISATTKLMLITSASNSVTVFWARGTLQGTPREFEIPLDSTLEKVAFSFSVDTYGTSMELISPAGLPINSSRGGAEVDTLNCGRLTILTKPFPGNYRVRITGSGRFWLAVEARSEIYLYGLRFVEWGGRPAHEGYFPIAGQPLTGKPATLEASVSGGVKSATFSLTAPSGVNIRQLEMKPVDSSSGHEYLATFDLPEEPFRVSVRGTDQNGETYQRVFHTLFHPATVAIVPLEGTADDVPPGKTAVFTYLVHNAGSAADFRILAYAGGGFQASVEPSEVKLEPGASARVRVSIPIPAGAAPGTGFDLTVSVTSAADPSVFNGTSRSLSVSARQ